MSSPTLLRRRPGSRAFTLLELIVVIVIIGILATLAVPTFQKVIAKTHDGSAKATLAAILRDSQALAAFGDSWDPSVTTAAAETGYVSSASGVSAAGTYVAKLDSTSDPVGNEIVYQVTQDRAILVASIRSKSGNVCTGAARASSIIPPECGPLSLDGTNNASGVVQGDGVISIPAGSTSQPAGPVSPGPFTLTVQVSSSKPVLSWTASSAATSYKVERAASSSFSGATVLVPSTTNLTYTDSSAGYGTFHYRVTASGAANTTPAVQTTNVTVANPVPGAPGSPTVGAVTTNSAALSWTAATGATGYSLTYTPEGGASLVATSTGTSTTLTGLQPGTKYTVTVAGTNTDGTSPSSAPASFVTKLTTPVITGTSSANGTSIQISGANVQNATKYSFYSKGPDDTTFVYIGQSATNSFNSTGLYTANTYSIYVVASNDAGASAQSATIVVDTAAKPATPSELRVINTSTSSARVLWRAPAGATSYQVQRGEYGNIGWTTIGTTGTSTGVGDWVYLDATGLSTSPTYAFRVAAVNAVGTSSYTAGNPSPATNAAKMAGTTGVIGNWEAVSNNGGNSFRLVGWVVSTRSGFDGRQVTITVNGNARSDYTFRLDPNAIGDVASPGKARLDVNDVHRGSGPMTGYDAVIGGIVNGTHTVCMTINNGVTSENLGCKNVTVS